MKRIIALITIVVVGAYSISAQNKNTASDSTKVKESDRNVMLNAENNTGPRQINVGLPASVGGTTILENGLPAVFFFWPEIPTKSWRADGAIVGAELLDLGQTAIRANEVGLAFGSKNNLGTDQLATRGSLNSDNYGLLRGDVAVSGPLNQKGLNFMFSVYGTRDPGTYRAEGFPKYYNDQGEIYKAALTQDYKLGQKGKGSISIFYKHTRIDNIMNKYAPFRLEKNGKAVELPNFRLGLDSYFENSGKVTLRDVYTGEMVHNDIIKDYGSTTNTFDLIGKNTLDNGLNVNYTLRYRDSYTGMYTSIMAGVDKNTDDYYYADNPTEKYTGEGVQNVLILASRRTPLKTWMGRFDVGRQSNDHLWSVGIDQWTFNTDRFITESSMYFQEVAPNPRKIVRTGGDVDRNLNGSLEYYNGTENKTALFVTDKWKPSNAFTLNFGLRLQYSGLRGDYIKSEDRVGKKLITDMKKSDIKHDWLTKATTINTTTNITKNFGVLAAATYNEEMGHLNKYSAGYDPDLVISKIPSAEVGVFLNHKLFSLVSKATYIYRSNYRTTVNFSHRDGANKPATSLDLVRPVVGYDVETTGWTTDVLFTPTKSFNLHFLLTFQEPKYKNFEGKVNFKNPNIPTAPDDLQEYNFNDKVVTGVPKMLVEIDPSYTWQSLKIWASARYFSKQYFNKPNTLELEGRWETFAGLNYKINKNFDVYTTFVNLLSQRGVNGSLPDADLILTPEQAKEKEGSIMSGTYIRPFTFEFGLKFKF